MRGSLMTRALCPGGITAQFQDTFVFMRYYA
jgi:hypothetical protein